MDCFKKVSKKEGVASFWRGNLTNILRYFPVQAFNFAFKSKFKAFFCPKDKSKKFRFAIGSITAGGVSGSCTLCLTYPLDYARTRLASDIGKGEADRKFKGLGDCLVKSMK